MSSLYLIKFTPPSVGGGVATPARCYLGTTPVALSDAPRAPGSPPRDTATHSLPTHHNAELSGHETFSIDVVGEQNAVTIEVLSRGWPGGGCVPKIATEFNSAYSARLEELEIGYTIPGGELVLTKNTTVRFAGSGVLRLETAAMEVRWDLNSPQFEEGAYVAVLVKSPGAAVINFSNGKAPIRLTA